MHNATLANHIVRIAIGQQVFIDALKDINYE
jgi:hypothetical protein